MSGKKSNGNGIYCKIKGIIKRDLNRDERQAIYKAWEDARRGKDLSVEKMTKIALFVIQSREINSGLGSFERESGKVLSDREREKVQAAIMPNKEEIYAGVIVSAQEVRERVETLLLCDQ